MHLNTEVEEILVEKARRVTGVRLPDGTIHQADVVVSNADVAWTYLNLIPARVPRARTATGWIKRKKYSMSLFVIYFGTKRRYNDDGAWRITTSSSASDYKGLLRDIFANKELPEDFSLYLHMPTMTDPSMAPKAADLLRALAGAPPGRGHRLDDAGQALPRRDHAVPGGQLPARPAGQHRGRALHRPAAFPGRR